MQNRVNLSEIVLIPQILSQPLAVMATTNQRLIDPKVLFGPNVSKLGRKRIQAAVAMLRGSKAAKKRRKLVLVQAGE
jgi:hypothetical protein